MMKDKVNKVKLKLLTYPVVLVMLLLVNMFKDFIKGKKALRAGVLVLLILLLLATIVFSPNRGNSSDDNSQKEGEVASLTDTKENSDKKDEPKPEITPEAISISTDLDLVECKGPDGKFSVASSFDCKNLNDFWKNNPVDDKATGNPSLPESNPPSNPSATPSPVPTSTPTPTPSPSIEPFTLTGITKMPCASTSCGGVLTLTFEGTNFRPDLHYWVNLTNRYGGSTGWVGTNTSVYNIGPDAMIVGGDFDNNVILDFLNLPLETCMAIHVIVTDATTLDAQALFYADIINQYNSPSCVF